MLNNQVKPKSFFNSCITIVKKYVECHEPLKFIPVDVSSGVYTLCNTNNAIVIEGKPNFFILKVKKSKGLYLHVSVSFKAPGINTSLEKNHEFKSITVQFFQGILYLLFDIFFLAFNFFYLFLFQFF